MRRHIWVSPEAVNRVFCNFVAPCCRQLGTAEAARTWNLDKRFGAGFKIAKLLQMGGFSWLAKAIANCHCPSAEGDRKVRDRSRRRNRGGTGGRIATQRGSLFD